MDTDLEKKILRAKELLATSKHISMATVNEDGTPHNSPVRFVYDEKLEHIYWASHPQSLHSVNIIRTGQIFLALFDRIERGGLYIKGEDVHPVEGAELVQALTVHNSFRAKEGSTILAMDYYQGNSPQRMWQAKITNLWVNGVERGADGHIARDGRQEITAQDLLN
jgi:hypothetical protein